jgi:8-oxo-dGTP pyrophosphatase MutT (NUDIX family)
MKSHTQKSANITEAATMILTREQAGRIQFYLLKRSAKSGFMPGNFVFPGGTIDAEDRDVDLFQTHSDLTPDEIASRFGGNLTASRALAYCVAAIRETLEEAGVLLACQEENRGRKLAEACQLRMSDDLAKDWFARLVSDTGWRLALTALSPWSHWITPELMKRRFDTRFFIADMPADQHCRPDSRETVQGIWISPQEGLEGNLGGTFPLSPPTLVTLHELLGYQHLEDLRKESRRRNWGQAILPRLVPLAKGAVIVEPWDPQYGEKEIHISLKALPASIPPVGEPFSRIWFDGQLWRPVSV